MLAIVPGALLFSGCGGGGSSSAALPNLRFTRQSNVEFPDAPGISGVLTVNFEDKAPGASARAAGTLQIYNTPGDSTNPAPTPRPFPDAPPGANTDNFFSVLPSNATYILVGNVVPTDGVRSDIALDLRGSYEGTPRFTLRGDFVRDSTVTLEAKFERGDSTLRGRIVNVNNATIPGATTGSTTTGATTTGATTTGATTTGATTMGATTTGATTGATTTSGTTGSTTAGLTMAGGTTAGGTTAGGTTAGGTTGATTGSTTAGSTTAGGTTVGLPPRVS